MDLSYVIEKIRNAEFTTFPFRHIEINQLFEQTDFEEIIHSPEITIKAVQDDEALANELIAGNYKPIIFPGCTTDYREYIKWHKKITAQQSPSQTSTRLASSASRPHPAWMASPTVISATSCEGFGVAMRLESPKSPAIDALQNFLHSSEFIDCIAEKFNITIGQCNYEAGIQKYLDGYEISPHPDVRRKALTFMVNINPSPTSFYEEHHTSYLEFKSEWSYVSEFWKENDEVERCWVPWEWCEIKKEQRKNNSMVMFAPDDDTMHAIKAKYNHLVYQRTQLYGNLWFKDAVRRRPSKWEDFLIRPSP